MPTNELNRWNEVLKTTNPIAAESLGKPIGVYFLEARNHLKFFQVHWEPAKDGSLPGLVSVSNLLKHEVGEELESLIVLAQELHANALFLETHADARNALLDRGHLVLDELGLGCEFVLDDDVTEPADEAFAAAASRAVTDASIATFIQALIDHSIIAASLLSRLEQLPGFQVSWIAEARQIAESLGAFGAPMLGRAASPQIDLRNRAMTLIDERCKQIAKVSNYVFRHQPEVLRPLKSAYLRRRKLAARRNKLAESQKTEG